MMSLFTPFKPALHQCCGMGELSFFEADFRGSCLKQIGNCHAKPYFERVASASATFLM